MKKKRKNDKLDVREDAVIGDKSDTKVKETLNQEKTKTVKTDKTDKNELETKEKMMNKKQFNG